MTDQEAAALYSHILGRLRDLQATELTDEIEVTVRRGELRSEGVEKSDTLQTPLSPREAVVVALRMLIAAVEPPIHRTEAEKALKAPISWRFDELEPWHPPEGAGPLLFPPRAGSLAVPELPALTNDEFETLRSHAAQLLDLARETEKEDDDANAR